MTLYKAKVGGVQGQDCEMHSIRDKLLFHADIARLPLLLKSFLWSLPYSLTSAIICCLVLTLVCQTTDRLVLHCIGDVL